MSKSFVQTEKSLLLVFQAGKVFEYQNDFYEILKSGKPAPNGKGECKTDIYIQSKKIADDSLREFKISIKQSNADFLENKMNWERAVALFGKHEAKSLIVKSVKTIEQQFSDETIAFFESRGKTEAKCLTIGWKFELFNKQCGIKSAKMILTNEQKLDVFAGTNLPDGKRNSKVNKVTIEGSGIANFVLVVQGQIEPDINKYFSELVPIEKYAQDSEIYFACKAVNFRVAKNKWDGDRPLAVYVDWKIIEGKLSSTLIFDNPLQVKANHIGQTLRVLLKKLNIDSTNFHKLEALLDPSIKKTVKSA